MTNKQVEATIKRMAEKYKVKTYLVKKGDHFCKANGLDAHLNRSDCSGNEVWVGIYENPEFKLISFFHELGHIKYCWQDDKRTYYEGEKAAWLIGLTIAEENGVQFSVDALMWAKECLESYQRRRSRTKRVELCFQDAHMQRERTAAFFDDILGTYDKDKRTTFTTQRFEDGTCNTTLLLKKDGDARALVVERPLTNGVEMVFAELEDYD